MIEKRLIYLLQTKLGIELSDDIKNDIHYALYDTKVSTMKMMHEATEKEKVKYYNELKLYAKRTEHYGELLSLIEILESGGSLRNHGR